MKIELRGLTVRFDVGLPSELEVLRNSSLVLQAGVPIAIRGPNGSGKSTLLRVISGVLQPTSGSVVVDGERLPSRRSCRWLQNHSAYLHQDPLSGMFPSLSLQENAALCAPRVSRSVVDPYRKSDRFRKLEKEIESLVPFYDQFRLRPVSSLSSGEQQILALSLAKTADADIVLLDEPTAYLDDAAGKRVEKQLVQWLREPRHCSIVITHDPGFAERLRLPLFSVQDLGGVARARLTLKDSPEEENAEEDSSGALQILPDEWERYFEANGKPRLVPVADLRPSRSRQTGIRNANSFMLKAYAGDHPKRKPIKVREAEDCVFDILDGNSTYANAVISGWAHLPCSVSTGE